jgi:hypothetical protein
MSDSRKVVRLVATARFLQAGRPVRVNEELELPEDEALELIAVGCAIRAPEQPAAKRNTYRRRDMEAEK